MNERDVIDVIVIGAGPAGVVAALRAADLGARTALVTRDEFGGMAANDGPVPVRTLAHAARLIREARQLGQYGIAVSEPVLDYPRLLARVREVVEDVRAHSTWREQIDSLGVSVYERAGARPIRRSAHHRNGDRAAAAGREIHYLHGRGQSAARRPRIRVHEHAQRCLEPDVGAAVNAGDWRRRDRGAGGFGFQRVWLARATLPSRPADSAHGGRRYLGGRRLRVSQRGDRCGRGLRRDRIVRERRQTACA